MLPNAAYGDRKLDRLTFDRHTFDRLHLADMHLTDLSFGRHTFYRLINLNYFEFLKFKMFFKLINLMFTIN